MTITSLTSEQKPSKAQARRVRTLTTEAVDSVLDEQDTFTGDQLQAVHANGGVFKQELATTYRAFVLSFARKMLGIVKPVRAQDTGLVPLGWTVKSDSLEGEINLVNLDYSSCPVQDGETYVNGDTMIEGSAGAYGSLGFAATLLKAQEDGKEIFPVEFRGTHYFVMPRTVLLDGHRRRRVACFDWGGKRWVLDFRWVGSGFDGGVRFVRPREL
ncbi:MAG: hypothetical protein AAB351_00235 [Patescibacteria group bacterium]